VDTLERIADWLDVVNRHTGRVVRWLALLMVLVQFGVVLLRYVYGVSWIALNESVLYMHATLLMLGAGYTLLVNAHVRVDILQARAGPVGKAWIDLFGHLVLLIPTMLALLYWSWPSVTKAWAILEGPISVGGIPGVFLLKSLIPAFCVLLIVQSLACLLRNILTLASGGAR
jgi:TRAP-type mannitol/chloroaromatic compound transport system permease small subunit